MKTFFYSLITSVFFLVASPVNAQAPTCTITASPTSIESGETSTLDWTSQNASSATLSPAIGTVFWSGTQSVRPTGNTTYELAVTGPFGQTTCSVTVTVTQPQEPPPPTFEPSRFITCEGAGCSACNLVEMANEIIIWLFGIIFLLFAVLMTVAGFGLVTSGGNPSALNAAKDKFTNAMIGLLIVMSAWLIVDTLLKSLLNAGEIEGFGPWAEVKCQVQTEPNEPVPGDPGDPGGTGGTGSTTASSTCPVRPLTPITDPFALRMERGETLIWENTHPELRRCAERKAGSSGTITSAYRPQAYQAHLYETWDKWCRQGLRDNTTAACSQIKSAVDAEMNRHQLSCDLLVARNSSTHGQGVGVDISGAPQDNSHCLRWFGSRDRVHYTYIGGGCTCN